ncbi:hypothetical protein BC834DRAFT_974694 [Gloeopeniophorella convolvens]|nr:hypothetical protein BC834DRAFT_974694 [Gloeopeniophorella convolvens]
MPPDYTQSMCELFMQLGAQDISVFFSRGDSGGSSGSSTTNDGTNRKQAILNPPASRPFVTALGTAWWHDARQPRSRSESERQLLLELLRAPEVPEYGYNSLHEDEREQETWVIQTALGMLSLPNDFPTTQSKPPLGILNPLLYSIGTASLSDSTSGTSRSCDMQGLSMVKGSDPIAGYRAWDT